MNTTETTGSAADSMAGSDAGSLDEGAWMGRRRLLGAGSITLAGYGASALIGIAAIRVFTALAPPDVLGRANLILTILTLLGAILVAPATATQLRFHAAAVLRGEAEAFTRSAALWALGGTAAATAVGAVGWLALRTVSRAPVSAAEFALADLLLFARTGRDVLMNRLQAERRQGRYVALVLAEAALGAAWTALLLLLVRRTVGYLAGQSIGALMLVGLAAVASPGGLRQGVAGARSAGRPFVAELWRYGAPLAPNGALNWLANVADRYVLAAARGSAAVGRYVPAFAIGNGAMTLLNAALNDVFRPALFEAVNAGRSNTAARVFRDWLLVRTAFGALALLALYVFGPPIAGMLLAPTYRPGAVEVMLWIGLGSTLLGIASTVDARILSLGASARILPPLVVGATANVLLAWWLVPTHGMVGAAQASCGSYAAQCATSAVMLWRAQPAKP